MSCLYEPIHGRFPARSLCDSYPDCVGCSYSDPFKQPKQMTNADRIRNMMDEELAKWMVGEQINGIYALLKGLEDDDLLHDFIEVINLHGAEEIKKEKLEWLRQEVTE